ncbi:ATP-dependent DNA helicase [Thiolapillus brandeum]|uniref:DNA 5'-3' helicase n=1 Tax=Thiolapillus brandeum TaxID=1076588 RepID=A0A7U6GJV9_9GAMM|nr:ATP-dependent DNA helicase [Thiolapillus brandeum]BAO44996.1 ATP-dependent DNA helicase DinG [Thiolapillus brandeum]
MIDVEAVLAPDGLLSQALPGFSWRRQQQEMAEAVASCIELGGRLIAEAGTGTGKTFAYLVPALLSGAKVIISTGTKNLQDQLFIKDLPLLREAMASPASVALLKGRANYLCLHRMENALQDTRGQRREVARHLRQVQNWSFSTRSGDIAELSNLPEDSQVWPLITSTGDNCLGSECPSFSKCHLVEARKRAQEADIVVINHHLLCADFSIKDEGFGELLPSADAYIIDEAHQLPDVASSFFGISVGTRQFLDLARDSRVEYVREAGDLPRILEQIDHLEKAARDFRLAFGNDGQRGAWEEVADNADVLNALDYLRKELEGLHGLLKSIEGRGKGLDSCMSRALVLMGELAQIISPENADEQVRWFEVHSQSVRLHSTPLDVAGLFQGQMDCHPAAWIFTSATLAVGESFTHFQQQLGLTKAETACWGSPFDYQEQALWFVPKGLPQPSAPEYTEKVMELALPLLEASGGRAFLLFTSYRALNLAADWLQDRLDYPLLVQGSAPKAELLRRFTVQGNAVLLGTSSFWEGVDVRGDALSLVIIDKLPFASPGDPVLKARLDAMRKAGGNPFMEYQVPQAAIALKQGAGRLIRDVTDKGVLVLCDPRMLRKGYGHTFLDAMPPFARTRELSDALEFLRSI